MGPHTANSYAILFDSMIRPLIPYGIKGAIWYQGESNTRSEKDAVSYYRMLSDMIHDWRFRWAEGDFPFIQVGLAGYTEYADYSSDCKWAILRDSQRKVTRNCPNCGIASAVDLGDVKDIHPKDKYTVACRLALWALEHTYAVPGIYGTSPEVSE